MIPQPAVLWLDLRPWQRRSDRQPLRSCGTDGQVHQGYCRNVLTRKKTEKDVVSSSVFYYHVPSCTNL